MTHAIKPTSQCILSATAIAAVLGALVSPAHAGIAEQALARANAKVQAAIVHDVCEVHSTEARDQLDIDDRAAYASILKELQRSLDAKDDPASWGMACKSARGEPQKILADYRGSGFRFLPERL